MAIKLPLGWGTRPLKGSLNVRISQDLHQRAALYAEEHDLKLNAVGAVGVEGVSDARGIGVARIPHLRGEMWGTRLPGVHESSTSPRLPHSLLASSETLAH